MPVFTKTVNGTRPITSTPNRGKLRYYFVLRSVRLLVPRSCLSSPLSDQTCTHARTHIPTTRYEHYTPPGSLLHNWAPCSDTKSSSWTAWLNYSKSQCRITLKTGLENRTVNDVTFHGLRGFKGHLFLIQNYYCTSNSSYNTGSTPSDAVNLKNSWAMKDNGMDFLTEQWQSRPLSKSCSTVTFHITGYSVGACCRP